MSGPKQGTLDADGMQPPRIPRVDELVGEIVNLEERLAAHVETKKGLIKAKYLSLTEECTAHGIYEDEPYMYVDGGKKRKVFIRRDEKTQIGKAIATETREVDDQGGGEE